MNKLKELRISSHLSQMNLATKLYVSSKSISAWETNRRVPRYKIMQKIEDFFEEKKESIFLMFFTTIGRIL